MANNCKEHFLLTTFEEDLPSKFENKEHFFNNLFTNAEFIEWFNSIIIENLGKNNFPLHIRLSSGKLVSTITLL